MKSGLTTLFFGFIIFLLTHSCYAVQDIDKEFALLKTNQTHFTFGLGMAGNPFLGAVNKDGFGYPKNELGLSNWLGFSYTWIYGAPSEEEINDAFKQIKAEYGKDNIRPYEIPRLIKSKINKGVFNYFTAGTVYLLFPLNFEGGWMWVSDNVRFRLGLGLPVLLAFGINFDF